MFRTSGFGWMHSVAVNMNQQLLTTILRWKNEGKKDNVSPLNTIKHTESS